MSSTLKPNEHGIPTLTNSNFDLWLDSLSTCLQALELKKLMKESTQPNEKYSDADEGKGLMLVKSTLDDTGRRYVIGVESVCGAIEKLKGLYGRDETLYQLEGEFNALEWTADQPAELFVNALTDLRIRMKALDENISDDRFIRKLIEQAPGSLSQIIALYKKDLMLNRSIGLSELETVIVKASRDLPTQKKPDEVTANFYSNLQRPNYRNRRPYCKSCRQTDHWTNECPNNRSSIIERQLETQTERYGGGNARTPPPGANIPDDENFRRSERPPEANNFAIFSQQERASNKTYLDNCSDEHVTGNSSILKNYQQFDQPRSMRSINGGHAIGTGDIELCGIVQGVYTEITLKNVLYIPSSPATIISQLKFEDRGCSVRCSSDNRHNYISLIDKYGCILAARRARGEKTLYETTYKPKQSDCKFTPPQVNDLLKLTTSDQQPDQPIEPTERLLLNSENNPSNAYRTTCNRATPTNRFSSDQQRRCAPSGFDQPAATTRNEFKPNKSKPKAAEPTAIKPEAGELPESKLPASHRQSSQQPPKQTADPNLSLCEKPENEAEIEPDANHGESADDGLERTADDLKNLPINN